jgi:endonuclease/exonuclease/phosphatase family metal-dependent hydrolase
MDTATLILSSAALGALLALFFLPRPLQKPAADSMPPCNTLRASAPTFEPAPAPCVPAQPARGFFPQQHVRIVCYNVLSTGYAGSMVAESPQALENGARLGLLRNRLHAFMQKAPFAIFALQEVSLPWAGSLALFFSQRNYAVVSAPYGAQHSEYMGVLIAYPREGYFAERAAVEMLMAAKAPPAQQGASAGGGGGGGGGGGRSGGSGSGGSSGGSGGSGDSWAAARMRENQIASVLLRPLGGGRPFSVTCVHQPCEFWDPCAMRIYAVLAAQAARDFARGAPYVLAGDFNSTPDSSAYETLVAGTSNRDTPPPEAPGDAWQPCVSPPLHSAYRQALGREPQFTTAALSVRDLEKGKPVFVGTLDYIFYSSEWACVGVGKLPSVPTLMPTKKEPSDHHVISAELELN